RVHEEAAPVEAARSHRRTRRAVRPRRIGHETALARGALGNVAVELEPEVMDRERARNTEYEERCSNRRQRDQPSPPALRPRLLGEPPHARHNPSPVISDAVRPQHRPRPHRGLHYAALIARSARRPPLPWTVDPSSTAVDNAKEARALIQQARAVSFR